MSTALWAADCYKEATTQLELNQCATAEYRLADEELNQIYTRFRAALDNNHKKALTEVQRTWVKFRDLSCKFELSNGTGGSAEPMAYSICLTKRTRARTQEFKDMANCEEGDITCAPWKY
ncbi:MAG: lysozyme inhibitor LprI family protein [Azoarcus sp.]|jgi:uncharacterized protein YecT (DUF1311 family)|nr:lysozyme inhibitor LprI family protein [Azoarcus sp.]